MGRHTLASVGRATRALLTWRLSRHPERYREIYHVLRRYQLHQVVAQLGLHHQHDEASARPVVSASPRSVAEDLRPRHLASALEDLGPCFIKLGQLLSTRPDLLPPAYIHALARLQDAIAPEPVEAVLATVEQELGAPPDRLFRSFDRHPLAAASIAQVHRAVLPDGQEVAVKVQRSGVRRRVEVDLEVLREVAQFADQHTAIGRRYRLVQMVGELEESLTQELDFRQEAEKTRRISQQIADFQRLATPTVFGDYTARRVLTLSFVPGHHLAELDPTQLHGLDGPAIARDLLTAYLKQIVLGGIFHCDPHPGNIRVTPDGRLALLDFGMVGRFDAGQKDSVILLLLAFSERQGERVAESYLELVDTTRDLDRRAFTDDVRSLVSRYHDMSGGRMALGTALLDLTRLAYHHQVPVPTAFTLLGKAMLNLDGTVRVLSAGLDPVQLIRDYMLHVMQRRISAQLSPGRSFAWVLDMKHLVENAPRRTEAVLGKLANDELTLRLEVDRLDEVLAGLTRAATRISLGVVAGSLIMAVGHVLGSRMREGILPPENPRATGRAPLGSSAPVRWRT